MTPLRIAPFVLALACLARPAAAHPLSPTTVTIAVAARNTLTVTLVIDADALITRLDTQSVGPVDPTAADREPVVRLIRQREAALLDALDLRVEGVKVRLAVQDVRVDPERNATIVLKGQSPGPRRPIVWQTSLTSGTYALSVVGEVERATVQWIAGTSPSDPVTPGDAGLRQAILGGITLGFTHIVPLGLDHVLFVVGLALVATRRRSLLLLVTSFTLAHSVTLGLGLYGIVSAPSTIVEPLIALSIAYVGIENLTGARHVPRRAVLVFLFGLLHGLGFAAVLAEITTSAATRLATLGAFNLGVELGQIAVLAVTLGALTMARRLRAGGDLRLASAGSAAVAMIGTLWTVQRIFGG